MWLLKLHFVFGLLCFMFLMGFSVIYVNRMKENLATYRGKKLQERNLTFAQRISTLFQVLLIMMCPVINLVFIAVFVFLGLASKEIILEFRESHGKGDEEASE